MHVRFFFQELCATSTSKNQTGPELSCVSVLACLWCLSMTHDARATFCGRQELRVGDDVRLQEE